MSFLGSIKSSLIVAFISGLAGFVLLLQDIVLAYYFAAGTTADAYQFAISFPMLAVNVFAGGTLLAVLVPRLVDLNLKNHDIEAIILVKKVRRFLAFLLVFVSIIWLIICPFIAQKVAKGFSFQTLQLSFELSWVVMPILFFAGLAGVDFAILNSRRHFIFISFVPAFMPALAIIFIITLGAEYGIYSAAMGLLTGSVILWISSRLITIKSQKYKLSEFNSMYFDLQLIKDYLIAAISSALLAGIFLTDIYLTSSLSIGSTATFGYAVRPVILLLSFITAVVGNVILPIFSHLVALQDWKSLKKSIIYWLAIITTCSIPLVIVWYKYDETLIKILYERGSFGSINTASVAAVQSVYLLQIPFYLVAVIGWRVMNSLNKNGVLLAITFICFSVNLVADLLMLSGMGVIGIAWGTNLAIIIWAILIVLYLLNFNGKAKLNRVQHILT